MCAGGSGTGEAKLFDTQNNYKSLDTLKMGNRGVYTLTFAPNGRRLAIAGGDQDIEIVTLK
jgi:hypothetical protein